MVKHEEYNSLLSQLSNLLSPTSNFLPPTSNFLPQTSDLKPLIEGENLPDFWIREDNDTYYIFVANPMTQTIEYPLDYCYAFTDQGATRQITVNHHGKTEAYTLNFKPMESIMLKVDANGIEQIDLGFEPKRMREQ